LKGSNGNITRLIDVSDTAAWKVVAYTYDDLNRLLTASTSAASSTSYRQQFAYSMLGNITGFSTTSGATSTYQYAETDYAAPQA
jgi:YD repeat-containing protein